MKQAAYDGNLTEIERLVRNGVSPSAKDYDSRTALVQLVLFYQFCGLNF